MGSICGMDTSKSLLSSDQDTQMKCGICWDTGTLEVLQCYSNHTFCTECLNRWREINPICPTCRMPIEKDFLAVIRSGNIARVQGLLSNMTAYQPQYITLIDTGLDMDSDESKKFNVISLKLIGTGFLSFMVGATSFLTKLQLASANDQCPDLTFKWDSPPAYLLLLSELIGWPLIFAGAMNLFIKGEQKNINHSIQELLKNKRLELENKLER